MSSPKSKSRKKDFNINSSTIEGSGESLLKNEMNEASITTVDKSRFSMKYEEKSFDKFDRDSIHLEEEYDYDDIDISKENPNLLLTSGSILTSTKAMYQNQKIKIMGRVKDSYLGHKELLKKVKIAKLAALFVFFVIQVFSIPRWCKADSTISGNSY